MGAFYFFDVKEVTNPDKMEDYRKVVFDTVEKYGGRYLVIGGEIETVEGDWQPGFTVLVEFENAEIARRWYASTEYTGIKHLRINATKGNVVLIDASVKPESVDYQL